MRLSGSSDRGRWIAIAVVVIAVIVIVGAYLVFVAGR